MAAQGLTRRQMAETLKVTPYTVDNDLRKPVSQDELRRLRDEFRSIVMERTQAGLIQGTLDVVHGAIQERDAKSLELSTRAAVNLDKLTVSASGEAQRVEVTGIPPVTNVDLKLLIQNLLAPGPDAKPLPS